MSMSATSATAHLKIPKSQIGKAPARPSNGRVAPRTLADVLHDLGDIDANRVRWHRLGRATVADVVNIDDHEDRLFELVDGVLVEKATGFQESLLAVSLSTFIKTSWIREDWVRCLVPME